MIALPRIALVHGPTPIAKRRGLDEMLGIDLWIKRDDATGGAEAGNKVRKLEFLVGDALARRADTIVTCGGLQSNHARATALVCASLGLACVLLLRVADPSRTPVPRDGNVLLDRLAGAEIRLVSREQRETIVRVSRASGLVLDPVYCGKAMHGLRAAVERGDIARGARVLFLRTGGLPGLLAQGETFAEELA